jgi:hypothetical protein
MGVKTMITERKRREKLKRNIRRYTKKIEAGQMDMGGV